MPRCPECGEEYSGAEMFCPKDGSRLGAQRGNKQITIPPQEDPLMGKVIQDRYRILELLGEGGMGVVYTAEHVEIEKIVALKVLRDDFSKRPEVVERFRQEARAASKIGHPNIVDVTDFGQLEDGGVYFVMEYLKGHGLSEVIGGAPVSLERAVPVIVQIAKALDAAHRLGIVHRDLKPENIFLVERDGGADFVKILDFGIAKISDRDSEGKRLTKTGMIFGTPEYMSPEQAAGKQLDHRVDIYALGCIMFEMFTGKVPYEGDSFMAVLTQHMFEPVPPIESVVPNTPIPESVRSVVYKAMAKEADERYPDMNALLEDLKRAVSDSGFLAESPTHDTAMRLSQELRGEARRTGARTGAAPSTKLDWSKSSEAVASPKKPGRGRLYLGIGLAVVVLGGAAAVVGLAGRGEKPEAPTRSLAALRPPPGATDAEEPEKPIAQEIANPEQPAAPAEVAGGPAAPEEAPPPEPKKIEVAVKSEPENAVIFVEGLGQVCSSAPCTVDIAEGTPVRIEARLDGLTAETTFTPSPENRDVVLKIEMPAPEKKASRPRRRSKPTRPVPEEQTASEPRSGGLKIPGIFKDR